jgi:hypothetical protein
MMNTLWSDAAAPQLSSLREIGWQELRRQTTRVKQSDRQCGDSFDLCS